MREFTIHDMSQPGAVFTGPRGEGMDADCPPLTLHSGPEINTGGILPGSVWDVENRVSVSVTKRKSHSLGRMCHTS